MLRYVNSLTSWIVCPFSKTFSLGSLAFFPSTHHNFVLEYLFLHFLHSVSYPLNIAIYLDNFVQRLLQPKSTLIKLFPRLVSCGWLLFLLNISAPPPEAILSSRKKLFSKVVEQPDSSPSRGRSKVFMVSVEQSMLGNSRLLWLAQMTIVTVFTDSSAGTYSTDHRVYSIETRVLSSVKDYFTCIHMESVQIQ